MKRNILIQKTKEEKKQDFLCQKELQNRGYKEEGSRSLVPTKLQDHQSQRKCHASLSASLLAQPVATDRSCLNSFPV